MDSVLLRVVVARAEDVVLVLLEKTEARTMRKLRTLLVVPPMERVPERGHGGKRQARNLSSEKEDERKKVVCTATLVNLISLAGVSCSLHCTYVL